MAGGCSYAESNHSLAISKEVDKSLVAIGVGGLRPPPWIGGGLVVSADLTPAGFSVFHSEHQEGGTSLEMARDFGAVIDGNGYFHAGPYLVI